MAKVTGIGGLFFKAKDPERLYAWYARYLGVEKGPSGFVDFQWRQADVEGRTVWAPFPEDSEYFGATDRRFMVNYIVDDLDGMLATLRAEGAEIDPKIEDLEYGRFAWVMDPEGNRVELWEPPKPASL